MERLADGTVISDEPFVVASHPQETSEFSEGCWLFPSNDCSYL